MKELLIRVAADHVARTPLETLRGFLRAWLLGSMAVSVVVCGNALVQGFLYYPDWTSELPMLLPVFVIWTGIAAIPVLVLLLVKWILFG